MKHVIIIGAGLGGLTAANLLAKKGLKVTLFESHSTPGGYTAGFYREGFYFESGTCSLEASPSVFKVMREIGVLEKIDFVKLPTRWVSDVFDEIPITYNDYKKMIYGAFLDEHKRLDRFFHDFDKTINLSGDFDKPCLLSIKGLIFFFPLSLLSRTVQKSRD